MEIVSWLAPVPVVWFCWGLLMCFPQQKGLAVVWWFVFFQAFSLLFLGCEIQGRGWKGAESGNKKAKTR